MDINIFISLIAGLGIGSIATAFISNWLDKKKETELNLSKILEDKYRGLLVFMACALDIEKKIFHNQRAGYPKFLTGLLESS